MKKSLIALAAASAFAAPAFAATGNVDVYGIMNIAVEGTASGEDSGVVDNASRIGFKGSEDLGGGMKAVWQIESQITGASNARTGVGSNTIGTRNTFVGVAGGFGTVLMGRHDTPYKMATGSMDLFADTIADVEDDRLELVAGLNDAHDARVANAVAYVSPTVSGFHAAVAVVLDDTTDDKDMDAYSLVAVYANGPLTVTGAYQNGEAETVNGLGTGTSLAASLNNDSDAWKVGVSYKIADATINAVYESADVDNVGNVDSYVLGASYALGPVVLKAQYTASSLDADVGGDSDMDMAAVGVDYNMSKRTSAYVVYAGGKSDIAAGGNSGWNVGIKHSF